MIRLAVVSLFSVFFVGSGAVAADPTAAQRYPNKPVRVIVPLAAGGQTDVVARLLTQKLAESFKQSLVVDNRSGGGGSVGTETAVRANPDGYTMLIVASTYAANAALTQLPYDPVNDVAPIVFLGETGFVVSVHPSVPVKNLKELIAYDKANPGKVNYGSGGAGSTTHLATELFNQMAGTRMAHIPYKGSGPALNDLIGGQVQLVTVSMPVAISQIRSNRVRGLAVTAEKRSTILPDVPTVAETIPGYEATSWFAIFGPKGLPRDIAVRWNSEVNRILQLPDVKERLAGLGIEHAGGLPDRLREVTRREIAKWQKVVKMANIKPEG
jgi:tripartite-type tricarboxylate transporter receptor subunit TctC